MQPDWVPIKARWAVTGVGAIIALVGLYIALTSVLTLTSNLAFVVEGWYGSIIGVFLVVAGIFTMRMAWSRPEPREPSKD